MGWAVFNIMANIDFDNIKSCIVDKFKLSEAKAKSNGTTIAQHIEDLLRELGNFTRRISLINDEEILILKLAILFHDIGKINKLFQRKLSDKKTDDLIPHNCLSSLFLKTIVDKLGNNNWLSLLTYIIFNHHTRGNNYFVNERYGIPQLINSIKTSQKEFFISFTFKDETFDEYGRWIIEAIKNKKQKHYIILSGLLIRLDHAASGELEVEEEPIKDDKKELLFSYFEKNGKQRQLRSFQQTFGIDKRADYQCIVADTGLGKTGLSILWSQRKKFYILPNRASVNAMYNTLKEIYGEEKVGLLHSTALFNLLNDYEDDISVLRQYDQTRVLSKPVTVCTADQLFTAAFNMPGYEKIYATLSYSDVVIDEIQGFQPQQIIPILKQIKETKDLGARYLIITATLPDIVAKKLYEYGFSVIENDNITIDSTKRHKIKIDNKKIEDLVDEMINKCQNNNKKVLVVTNTVKKAQEVYKTIKDKLKYKNNISLNILHSRFIWKDRQEKEKSILEECKQNENGNYINQNGCVWVCTQLVEASLDIDFDYLYTEASTADSLIQRMGRVWRHRNFDYNGDENIIIATDVQYRVYEEILVKKSIEMIENELQDCFLFSQPKRKIVKELYSENNLNQWGSKYLEEWRKYENMINSGWNFILEENAQKAFRDVMSIDLIPEKYKQKIENKLQELNNLSNENDKEKKRLERAKILKEIQKYKVPVPIYLINPKVAQKLINSNQPIEWLSKNYEIGILNGGYEYDENLGLTGRVIETEEYGNIL